MKVCAIIYHKNAIKKYSKKWIIECLNSICNQSYTDFDILELNYGESDGSLARIYHFNKRRLYWKIPMKSHALAMNFLLDAAFTQYNYDYVFNVNVDDYYSLDRFKIQLSYAPFEICSTNYTILNRAHTKQIDYTKKCETNSFIQEYFNRNLNIICHPSICFYKSFWKKDPGCCYRDEVPVEDLKLWKRAIKAGVHMIAIPEFLTIYRKHPEQITQMKFKNE